MNLAMGSHKTQDNRSKQTQHLGFFAIEGTFSQHPSTVLASIFMQARYALHFESAMARHQKPSIQEFCTVVSHGFSCVLVDDLTT